MARTSGYSYPAKSMALRNLNAIKALAAGNETGDVLTRAHRAHLVYIIEEGLDDY